MDEQQTQQAAPVEAPKPKRERPAPSPKQARAAAAKKRVKRAIERALESDDPDELERVAAALGNDGAPRLAEAVLATLPADEAAPAVPAVGPTPEELALGVQMARGLIGSLAGALEGTRFDPMQPRPDPMGGPQPIVPAALVTEALGAVLAKRLPAMVTTPEGQLALACAFWLGPPTLELAAEKLMGGGEAPADGAGVKAAA